MKPAGEGQWTSWRSRFLAAFALALAGAAYLAFALPAGLYLGNASEFGTPLFELLAPAIFGALCACLVFAFLAALLPPRAYVRAMVITSTLLLLAWVQGTLLVWEYGLFDGSQIDWAQRPWRGWLDASIWIAALLAADAYRDRIARVVPRLALVACLLQAALAAGLLLSRGVHSKLSAPPPDDALVVLAQFSPRANVLQVLADGMQTDVLLDLLDEDGGQLERELDGFVLFEDNLGAFPYTHMSVPALVSGRRYDNSVEQGPFLDGALGSGSIFEAARAAGYEVEIGVPDGGINEVYRHARAARLLALPADPGAGWNGSRQESLLLADLVLFRIVPHFAKAFVYNDQSWLFQSLFGESATPGRQYLAHVSALRSISAGMSATRPRPTFKFLHLMLSHRPMVMNRDCSYARKVLTPDRENVRNQVRCGLLGLRELLAQMRRLHIYDSATVVISGDHGTFLPPTRYASGSPAMRLAFDRGLAPAMIGHARPLLLVKPPRSHGSLRRSSAPTSVLDVAATIAAAAGIRGKFAGADALALSPDAPRLRYFTTYEYLRNDWTQPYLSPMREYLVQGRSDDVAAWSPGRNLAPASAEAR